MVSEFTVAGMTVAPGTKTRQMVDVTTRASGLPLQMPLAIAHGEQPGPVLCVVSGVHGDEYEGGEAICRVFNELDPHSLSGTFLGVPTINMPALESGTRTSPIDGINLNRIFPGNPDGGISDRIAHFMFHEVAAKADYLIDFHGGGIDLFHASVVNYRIAPDPGIVDKARRFAESTGLEIMVHGKPGAGQLPDELIMAGRPSINIETGGGGVLSEENIVEDLTATWNVMKHLHMVAGEPSRPAQRIHVKNVGHVRVHTGGIWNRRHDLSIPTHVAEGDVLGTVSDVFRDVKETVTAPYSGYLYVYRSSPKIQAGDWIAFLARETETETLS